MGPFILAWLIGEGIIVWRSIRVAKAPPVPGALLASSGIFALLAIAAEYDPARPAATLAAYGLDLAAMMNLYPPVTGGGAGRKGAPPSAPPVHARPPGPPPGL